jgi:glyoxylase-like metal-dependent hydrolase (beta-lactamase superfamily II)
VLDSHHQAELHFPFAAPLNPHELIEVHPGVLWARLPLPFRLDHINVYFIDDGDGWAVIDTGIGDEVTRAVWQRLTDGPLRGRRLTRLIVTHFHPDHIGLAGWLAERYGVPLLTSQTTYLSCVNISLSPGALDAKIYRDFYLRHGLDAQTTAQVATRGHNYLRMVTGLPPTFRRLVAQDVLNIGGRVFGVLSGDGHAPEQLMLHCPAEKLFFAADQILAKITPNVSVWAVEPDGNPLDLYLRSLRSLQALLPPDTLVLPGHQLPFRQPQVRCAELIRHHEERCAAIASACHGVPRTTAEIVPFVFRRPLDPHQMSFAFSEVQAHVNYMVERGELFWGTGRDDVYTVESATTSSATSGE